jgi:hypothetical protein
MMPAARLDIEARSSSLDVYLWQYRAVPMPLSLKPKHLQTCPHSYTPSPTLLRSMSKSICTRTQLAEGMDAAMLPIKSCSLSLRFRVVSGQLHVPRSNATVVPERMDTSPYPVQPGRALLSGQQVCIIVAIENPIISPPTASLLPPPASSMSTPSDTRRLSSS